MTISARNERMSVEQALLEVVKQLPDPRVEQLLDFARWLRTQGAQAYDATDMDAAQLERDELAWFNAYQVRRDEFRTMARQAVADFAAGKTTEMVIEDGRPVSRWKC